MADYNSLKVPELKKLLNERGLTQAGNKADLIARLVENDKEQAKASEPKAGTSSNIDQHISHLDATALRITFLNTNTFTLLRQSHSIASSYSL